jgi:parvulin-like peptidyl-prolyl isomerase
LHSIRFTISTLSTALALASLLTLAGCPQDQDSAPGPIQQPVASQPPPPQPPPEIDQSVATIDGLTITMEQLQQPLVDAYGLNMLFKLVELDLAKQQASRLGITVTAHDVAGETQRYLDQVFKDDKQIASERDQLDADTQAGKTAEADQLRRSIEQEQQRLLAQLLDNQKLTRAEFDLAIESTTYLRAIVQPAVMAQLTDDNLQESFRARYGEKVRVRHIACVNPQEIGEAKRRLASGESFAQVAAEMSGSPDKELGGELPAFSRTTPGLPQAFKDVAFALTKPGDISEIVQAQGAYHLIQLEQRIDPTAVKFEDVKDSVRHDLAEALTESAVKQLRIQLGQIARRDLRIQNPVLARQFDEKVIQHATEIHDRDQIRSELDREHNAATTAPAATVTEPARQAPAAPASTPVTSRP